MSEPKLAQIIKPWGDYLTPGLNAEIIEVLEDALRAAKSGECVALGIVMINPSGYTKTRGVKGSRGYGEIVGAASVLHLDLLEQWRVQ